MSLIITENNLIRGIHWVAWAYNNHYTGIIQESKSIHHLLKGNLHREDGPANEWEDGTKSWYLEGKRHREDGPAIEFADGEKQWYLENKLIQDLAIGLRGLDPVFLGCSNYKNYKTVKTLKFLTSQKIIDLIFISGMDTCGFEF